MNTFAEDVKPSNGARILKALMDATGITSSTKLSMLTGVPIRAIQRMKRTLRYVTYDVNVTNDASHMTQGRTQNSVTYDVGTDLATRTPRRNTLSGIVTSLNVVTDVTTTTTAREESSDSCVSELLLLSERLFEVCGDGIANPGAYPGLLSMSVPSGWLRSGCDLDLDVIPTLQALSAAALKRGRPIKSWQYFSQAVADARATRLAPMPEGVPQTAAIVPAWKLEEERRAKEWREALDAAAEREKALREAVQ